MIEGRKTTSHKDEAPNQKLIYSIENTNPSFLVWNKETGAILKDNFSSYSFCPDTIQRVYNNGKPIRYRYTPEAEFSFSILSDYKEVISTEYTPAYGRMPKRVIHPNPFYNGTRYSFFYSQDGNLYEKQEIEETGNNYCYRYSTETNTLSSTEETK